MNRGDIVLTVGRGASFTKQRPSLIVQADALMPVTRYSPCARSPLISRARFYRVPMGRDPGNGLHEDSEVEIDLIQPIRQERIRNVIGSASPEVMTVVDQALRRWFSL